MPGYANPENTATGKDVSFVDQCNEMQNFAGTQVSNWHKSSTVGSRFVPDGTKENLADAPTSNGVKLDKKAQQLSKKNTSKAAKNAMTKWAKPAHKRAARAIGYFLTIGITSDRVAELALILAVRLSSAERAGLAYAALRSMDEEEAYKVASLALFGVLGGKAARS